MKRFAQSVPVGTVFIVKVRGGGRQELQCYVEVH